MKEKYKVKCKSEFSSATRAFKRGHFSQIDIVFLSCHLQGVRWTDYVRVFKLFPFGSQNLFLFGLKWSPQEPFPQQQVEGAWLYWKLPNQQIFPSFFLEV